MKQEENPYASPEALHELEVKAEARPYTWLHGVALAILVLGWGEFFCSIAAFFSPSFGIPVILMVHPALGRNPRWILYFGWWGASIALLFRSLIMTYGASHMRSQKNHRWGVASAIAAMIGVAYPLFWVDSLLGIWALVILHRKDTRAAFNESSQ